MSTQKSLKNELNEQINTLRTQFQDGRMSGSEKHRGGEALKRVWAVIRDELDKSETGGFLGPLRTIENYIDKAIQTPKKLEKEFTFEDVEPQLKAIKDLVQDQIARLKKKRQAGTPTSKPEDVGRQHPAKSAIHELMQSQRLSGLSRVCDFFCNTAKGKVRDAFSGGEDLSERKKDALKRELHGVLDEAIKKCSAKDLKMVADLRRICAEACIILDTHTLDESGETPALPQVNGVVEDLQLKQEEVKVEVSEEIKLEEYLKSQELSLQDLREMVTSRLLNLSRQFVEQLFFLSLKEAKFVDESVNLDLLNGICQIVGKFEAEIEKIVNDSFLPSSPFSDIKERLTQVILYFAPPQDVVTKAIREDFSEMVVTQVTEAFDELKEFSDVQKIHPQTIRPAALKPRDLRILVVPDKIAHQESGRSFPILGEEAIYLRKKMPNNFSSLESDVEAAERTSKKVNSFFHAGLNLRTPEEIMTFWENELQELRELEETVEKDTRKIRKPDSEIIFHHSDSHVSNGSTPTNGTIHSGLPSAQDASGMTPNVVSVEPAGKTVLPAPETPALHAYEPVPSDPSPPQPSELKPEASTLPPETAPTPTLPEAVPVSTVPQPPQSFHHVPTVITGSGEETSEPEITAPIQAVGPATSAGIPAAVSEKSPSDAPKQPTPPVDKIPGVLDSESLRTILKEVLDQKTFDKSAVDSLTLDHFMEAMLRRTERHMNESSELVVANVQLRARAEVAQARVTELEGQLSTSLGKVQSLEDQISASQTRLKQAEMQITPQLPPTPSPTLSADQLGDTLNATRRSLEEQMEKFRLLSELMTMRSTLVKNAVLQHSRLTASPELTERITACLKSIETPEGDDQLSFKSLKDELLILSTSLTDIKNSFLRAVSGSGKVSDVTQMEDKKREENLNIINIALTQLKEMKELLQELEKRMALLRDLNGQWNLFVRDHKLALRFFETESLKRTFLGADPEMILGKEYAHFFEVDDKNILFISETSEKLSELEKQLKNLQDHCSKALGHYLTFGSRAEEAKTILAEIIAAKKSPVVEASPNLPAVTPTPAGIPAVNSIPPDASVPTSEQPSSHHSAILPTPEVNPDQNLILEVEGQRITLTPVTRKILLTVTAWSPNKDRAKGRSEKNVIRTLEQLFASGISQIELEIGTNEHVTRYNPPVMGEEPKEEDRKSTKTLFIRYKRPNARNRKVIEEALMPSNFAYSVYEAMKKLSSPVPYTKLNETQLAHIGSFKSRESARTPEWLEQQDS